MSYEELSNIDKHSIETAKTESVLNTLGRDMESLLRGIMPFANQALVDQYEEEKAEKERYREENLECKDTIAYQSNKIKKLERLNEALHEEISMLQDCSGEQIDDFILEIDCREFENDKEETPSKEWVQKFWNKLFEIACTTNDAGKFIISCAANAAVVYKIIKESKSLSYTFKGKQADFVYRWNANIVNRIKDGERAKKLKCKLNTFKANLKDLASIVSWKNLSIEGQSQKLYSNASEIKKIIEKLVA